MRNLILLPVFVLATIFQTNANNTPKASTLQIIENQKTIVLNFYAAIAEAQLFTITDQSGNIVFTESVEKYDNKVSYNLKKLPAGNYIMKVEGESFLEIYETSITKEIVSLINAETFYAPQVTNLNGRKFEVKSSIANKEDIDVSIFNEDGEIVYSYNDKVTGNYSKTFNLEQLKSGNYTVFVSTDHFSNSSQISL